MSFFGSTFLEETSGLFYLVAVFLGASEIRLSFYESLVKLLRTRSLVAGLVEQQRGLRLRQLCRVPLVGKVRLQRA